MESCQRFLTEVPGVSKRTSAKKVASSRANHICRDIVTRKT